MAYSSRRQTSNSPGMEGRFSPRPFDDAQRLSPRRFDVLDMPYSADYVSHRDNSRSRPASAGFSPSYKESGLSPSYGGSKSFQAWKNGGLPDLPLDKPLSPRQLWLSTDLPWQGKDTVDSYKSQAAPSITLSRPRTPTRAEMDQPPGDWWNALAEIREVVNANKRDVNDLRQAFQQVDKRLTAKNDEVVRFCERIDEGSTNYRDLPSRLEAMRKDLETALSTSQQTLLAKRVEELDLRFESLRAQHRSPSPSSRTGFARGGFDSERAVARRIDNLEDAVSALDSHKTSSQEVLQLHTQRMDTLQKMFTERNEYQASNMRSAHGQFELPPPRVLGQSNMPPSERAELVASLQDRLGKLGKRVERDLSAV